MFLVRSAFWLTIGFMIVAPTVGADMGDVAGDAAGQIAKESQQALSQGLQSIPCETVECHIGRAVLTSALDTNAGPSNPDPMQHTPSGGASPVPPPRPDWAS